MPIFTGSPRLSLLLPLYSSKRTLPQGFAPRETQRFSSYLRDQGSQGNLHGPRIRTRTVGIANSESHFSYIKAHRPLREADAHYS
ncbi:hypothetical protein Bind_0882 [Beijerinckia indica subsp. indica ATCC 9039]|uniref:Uncharacterized protein n=1 Tax=Beijerinckia indica subsp. indica (strain ATCC 9039 / DSM 1715 / NCIMB 8712) TaxID=395963 RepID=B2IHL1_BEII9|nr:hypothetical protein Bind_0882 [Beijerinckia indica subsp. indica ATCC 9039]